MNPKAIDLFSGFGGFSLGAKAAGYEVIAAFEKDSAIASVYHQNHGNHCHTADVSEVDFREYQGIDLLLASPPCQEYSQANQNQDRESDRALVGLEVAKAIAQAQPRHVLVENVPQFRHSKVFDHVLNALDKGGYKFCYAVLNAADYGVPQTRKRVFLMATRDRPVIPMPTHHWQPTLLHEQWVGWYNAIADLLPSLPDSELAPWQQKRLPDLTGQTLLVERVGARSDRALVTREAHQPSNTVRALGGDGHWRQKDAIVEGRVVALSPRCLARLQSFPDDFQLPEKKALACKGIGNAVPPLLATKLIQQFKQ